MKLIEPQRDLEEVSELATACVSVSLRGPISVPVISGAFSSFAMGNIFFMTGFHKRVIAEFNPFGG